MFILQRSPLCHLKDLKYYLWKKKNNNQTTENQTTHIFRCHALGTMSLFVILLGSKCAFGEGCWGASKARLCTRCFLAVGLTNTLSKMTVGNSGQLCSRSVIPSESPKLLPFPRARAFLLNGKLSTRLREERGIPLSRKASEKWQKKPAGSRETNETDQTPAHPDTRNAWRAGGKEDRKSSRRAWVLWMTSRATNPACCCGMWLNEDPILFLLPQ